MAVGQEQVAVLWFRSVSVNCSNPRSLDFIVNRFFVKLFNANLMDTAQLCQEYLDFDLLSIIVEKRRKTIVAHRRTGQGGRGLVAPLGFGKLVKFGQLGWEIRAFRGLNFST